MGDFVVGCGEGCAEDFFALRVDEGGGCFEVFDCGEEGVEVAEGECAFWL